MNFREPESSAVDVLGKSLYVDLNQLSTLRRPSAPVVAPPASRRTRCFEPESTRSGAKSILLTEDVLSVSDYSSLTALRPSRYSFCSQGDLEPDLIQVIFWYLTTFTSERSEQLFIFNYIKTFSRQKSHHKNILSVPTSFGYGFSQKWRKKIVKVCSTLFTF